jgi:hypothetical protein
LTLLAQGTLPDFLLVEDANDLIDFLEYSRRTIPRTRWATESVNALNRMAIESVF